MNPIPEKIVKFSEEINRTPNKMTHVEHMKALMVYALRVEGRALSAQNIYDLMAQGGKRPSMTTIQRAMKEFQYSLAQFLGDVGFDTEMPEEGYQIFQSLKKT